MRQVLDGGVVFGLDFGVLFLDTLNFNHGRRGQVGHQLGFCVGLAFVFGGGLFERRAVFLFVDRVAFVAFVGEYQRLGGGHIDGLGLREQAGTKHAQCQKNFGDTGNLAWASSFGLHLGSLNGS